MSSMGIGKILLLALAPAAALVALLYVLGVFHIAANHEANQHLVVQSALESVNSAMKNAQNSAEKAGGAGEANAFLSLASPPNLPSVPVTDEALDKSRGIYGGKGEKAHLGGFTDLDVMGVSPPLWQHMMGQLNIHSLVDVGCGKGVSTLYFERHGVDVLCVEGSHDATTQSLLKPEHVVEHDFSRGPWWPEKTYDAAWSVEFLEHVGRPYMLNYLPVLKKAALIFATHSQWGGWHHVEVKKDTWWRNRMEAQGFVYSENLTNEMRNVAKGTQALYDNAKNSGVAQHLWTTMQVFINPSVAALPQHHHIFGGPGCFGNGEISDPPVPCPGADALSGMYLPVKELASTDTITATWEKEIGMFRKP